MNLFREAQFDRALELAAQLKTGVDLVTQSGLVAG
jgi:hypothetical protein